jgi:hypothetical protein
VRLDPAADQQVRQVPPGVEVAAARLERHPDRLDQHGRRGSLGLQTPRRRVGVLEHEHAARLREARVGVELLVVPADRRQLEPCVHQVERVRLELRREEVVLDDAYVLEPERLRSLEQRRLDVRADDLTLRSDPFAEDREPAERPAADVEHTLPAAVTDLLQ